MSVNTCWVNTAPLAAVTVNLCLPFFALAAWSVAVPLPLLVRASHLGRSCPEIVGGERVHADQDRDQKRQATREGQPAPRRQRHLAHRSHFPSRPWSRQTHDGQSGERRPSNVARRRPRSPARTGTP